MFSHLAVQGVVPDLVLLVVVAAGLAYGSELGLVLGFGAGLLLDLAPPADHYAGRWALALMVVGYVAGRLGGLGSPAGRPVAAGGRGGGVRRDVGVRAHRAAAARPGRRRRRAAAGRGGGPLPGTSRWPWSSYPSPSDCSRRSSPTGSWRDRRRSTGENRSRLRLVVIQALVFSLFATLLVRLYYLQVVSGDEYAAQAASQSIREIVVQPQRGLIVDDEGRPLVANRTSWVVSIDRGTLAKLPEDEQRALLHRVARVTDVAVPRIHRLLTTCGDDKARAGGLLERVAVPAGAGRGRRAPADGAAGARAARGLPGRDRRAAEPARLPGAVRHQRRAPARLPQPDHRR